MAEISISLLAGGPEHITKYAEQIISVYVKDSAESSQRDTLLYSEQWFHKQLLDEYFKSPNFKIITLWDSDLIIGFSCGCSLPKDTVWWADVKEPLPEGFAKETGQRTFALLELVLDRAWRGKKLGSKLHVELLTGRTERRVTLLASPEDRPAYSIWQHWGYQKIGTAEPADDGTIMDVFVRNLS